MLRSVQFGMLATTMLAGMAVGALAQGLVTADHVGKADAPNTLTMRMNPDQSPGNNPHKEIGAKYAAAWEKWAEAHPDWQVNVRVLQPGHRRRACAPARAGPRRPRARLRDGRLVPARALRQERRAAAARRVSSPRRRSTTSSRSSRQGITGPDGHIYAWWWGTDLRVLYYNKDIVANAPQTWDELQADRARRASKTGVEGVLFNGGRWEGTTFDWLANFWAPGRRARRRQRQADLRRRREQATRC